MRLLSLLTVAIFAAFILNEFHATAAPKPKPPDQVELVKALTDAVCALVVLGGPKTFPPFSPEVCRSAPHIVFVSSQTFTGNFVGSPGADFRCNQLASEADLAGIYKAWTADTSSPDTDPRAFRFRRSSGPYILVDGTVVADDWADLTAGNLSAPIELNENGNATDVEVWTNVAIDGTRLDVAEESGCDHWNVELSA